MAGAGIGADAVTLCGFAIGLAAVPMIAGGYYAAGLVAFLLNRLADGLDGAVARHRGPTDFGGYLDIVGDFLIYAALPFAFALAQPENALAAAFLVLSFVGTGSTFLAYAIIAAKRGVQTSRRGTKAFYYLGGLTEGSETIAVFALACLFPASFPWLAWGFGALCWVTTASRIAAARRDFGAAS